MKRKHLYSLASTTALAMFTGSALAASLPKQGTYDYTSCYSAVNHAEISYSGSNSALIREWTGTNLSATPGGFLDKSSFHCVALVAHVDGKISDTVYCDVRDHDGDRIFSRFVSDGTHAAAATLLGTGKYQGIERTGKGVNLGPFPVAKPGTFQTCVRNTGTYKLK